MNDLPVESIPRSNSDGRRRLSKSKTKKDLEDELFGGPQAQVAVDDEIRALLCETNLKSDNPEAYKEDLRKKNQLQLESRLHVKTAMRLGVYNTCPSLWVSKTTSASEEYEYDIGESYLYEFDSEDDYVTTSVTPKNNNKLQLARNKLRLYNVTIHPCCVVRGRRQGKTVTGTLEAHDNGFRYKTYSIPFELDIMFHNVRCAFFQDGDKKMAPLCHLHLHNPILVGTETTKDIQFRTVQQTLNMRRLVRDSDEFKKENQKSKENSEVIWNFISKVNPICLRSNLFRFKEVKRKRGFYGELTLEEQLTLPAIFVFTVTCLVQLEHMPFTVVILKEIEIVNLVHAEPGIEMFNMTIVFKNFKRDVLQISSIPSAKLISIKETLDIAHIKYYESQYSENKLDIPLWRYLLKKITDSPKNFIEEGGWSFLNPGNFINLENLFQQDLSGIISYSDREPRKKTMPLTATTRTMPVGTRVMVSSDESECDSSAKVNEKEIKHTSPRKTAKRQMVMSDESDDED